MADMFFNLSVANLLLCLFNTAVLFAEVGGRWTPGWTFAPKTIESTTNKPDTMQHIGPFGGYMLSLPVYAKNKAFTLSKSKTLLEVLVKSHDETEKKRFAVPLPESGGNGLDENRSRKVTSELNNGKHRYQSSNDDGLILNIRIYLRSLSKTTRNTHVSTINTTEFNEKTVAEDNTTEFNEKTVAEDNTTEFNEGTLGEDNTIEWSDTSTLQTPTFRAPNNESPFVLRSNLSSYVTNLNRRAIGTQQRFPFEVAVVVSKPKGPERNAVIFVPLMPDMTVLDAFRSATRQYMDNNTSRRNIPFNIWIEWNKTRDCFVTSKAVGLESRRKYAWYFTVRNYAEEIVYQGRCLPEENVILRPNSIVTLTFERTRRRLKKN